MACQRLIDVRSFSHLLPKKRNTSEMEGCWESELGYFLWHCTTFFFLNLLSSCELQASQSRHAPPVDPESPVVILVRLQRAGKLCSVLGSFASICESCRRAERRDWRWGGAQVLCRAWVCTAVRRDPPQPTLRLPCQPLNQAASGPPPLPLPQLAGSQRVGLGSWRSQQAWQTSPRWPPCSKAGFALASLLHHSLSYWAREREEGGAEGGGGVLLLPVLMHFCTWDVGVLNSAAAFTLSNDDFCCLCSCCFAAAVTVPTLESGSGKKKFSSLCPCIHTCTHTLNVGSRWAGPGYSTAFRTESPQCLCIFAGVQFSGMICRGARLFQRICATISLRVVRCYWWCPDTSIFTNTCNRSKCSDTQIIHNLKNIYIFFAWMFTF